MAPIALRTWYKSDDGRIASAESVIIEKITRAELLSTATVQRKSFFWPASARTNSRLLVSKAKNPDSLESWKITRAVLILAPLTSKIYLVVSGLYIITVSTLSCFHSQLVNGPWPRSEPAPPYLQQLYTHYIAVRWSYDYSANSSQLTLSSLASLEIMCPKIRHKQSSLFCWPALLWSRCMRIGCTMLL